MIPVLDKIINLDSLSIFQTTDNKFGIGFELLPCDLEVDDPLEYQRNLLSFIRTVSANTISRVKLKVEDSKKAVNFCERGKSTLEVGYTQKSIFLFIELEGEPFVVSKLKHIFSSHSEAERSVKSLKEVYDQALQCGLKIKPLNENGIRDQFVDPRATWIKGSGFVADGSKYIGVIRLLKPSREIICESSLAEIIKNLPRPFEISVSFQKRTPGKIRFDLEKRLKQTSTQDSPSDQALYESTVNAIKESVNSGAQFVDYEFIVLMERNTEELLKNDLKYAQNKLSLLGDFLIETFGATSSWLATLLGNSSHVTLREVDETFSLYLPIWHLGEKEFPKTNSRSLPMLRSDLSVYSFDLFSPEFSVYNSIIVGTSGRGKSVFTGLLSKALLNDPNIQIIKLDVGGSHSKECELFGGTEHVLELNKPSRINPFEIVYQRASHSEKVGILSRFLGALIQEQGEVAFSKELRSQIEESIQSYLSRYSNYLVKEKGEDRIGIPCLQEFFDLQIDFPRRNLLKRWVKGGIYESAFSISNSFHSKYSKLGNCDSLKSKRLRYYNFSQVFQASDPEFAQAGLAAVLAQFNTEVLSAENKRIVLICDETPFFIKSCFDFFKFSTANVRKFGHAVVLITQLSSDLIVNGDTGIIENSPQRFLFSVDGDEGEYQSKFNLKSYQVDVIRKLCSIPGEISEVFLQTAQNGRKLQIKITKEEYWELTSSKQDTEKLKKLRSFVPELSLKEAIRCLSIV